MSLLKESEEVIKLLPELHSLPDKSILEYRENDNKMAYEVIILYHLHMPLYFTGTFTEYLPFTDPTGLFMFMRISYSLERQIILLVCRGKVYRRSGSSIHGRKRSIRRNRPLGTHTLYFPRTDTVEPTPIPLAGIHIKNTFNSSPA